MPWWVEMPAALNSCPVLRLGGTLASLEALNLGEEESHWQEQSALWTVALVARHLSVTSLPNQNHDRLST